MYYIYLNGQIIYNPEVDIIKSHKFINPFGSTVTEDEAIMSILSAQLEEQENAAGSLTLKVPSDIAPINKDWWQYDMYTKYTDLIHTGLITVKDDQNNYIWSGTINADISKDFYNQISIKCDGVLSFLNNTYQPSAKYTNYTMTQFVTALIDKHNNITTTQPYSQKVQDYQKFYVGQITVNDGTKDRYTEWESTFKCFQDLIADNGGFLRLRPYDGSFGLTGYYLDYLAEYPMDSDEQCIYFGENLLDFATNYNVENYYTVLVPFGKENETTHVKIDVRPFNNGSYYITNDIALNNGEPWVEKVIENSEIESAQVLKDWALSCIDDTATIEKLSLDLSAVDLHNLKNTVKSFKMLHKVKVVSDYHKYNEYLPITKMSRNLLDPSQDKVSLGEVVATNLSSSLGDMVAKNKDESFIEKIRRKVRS